MIPRKESLNMPDYYTFMDFQSFYDWLDLNHNDKVEANLFIYKKNSSRKGITYEDSVKAALCHGWIDSTKRSNDENKYVQRFSPRKKKSNWAISNIKRMKELIENNLMTEEGLKYFDMELIENLDGLIKKEEAEKNRVIETPDYVLDILTRDDTLLLKFKELPASHKKRYLDWIRSAKKDETKYKRIEKMVRMLKENRSINEL
jgi:uncharacterized protein YdeI (YjbR/CyaY-like superfamily)